MMKPKKYYVLGILAVFFMFVSIPFYPHTLAFISGYFGSSLYLAFILLSWRYEKNRNKRIDRMKRGKYSKCRWQICDYEPETCNNECYKGEKES